MGENTQTRKIDRFARKCNVLCEAAAKRLADTAEEMVPRGLEPDLTVIDCTL